MIFSEESHIMSVAKESEDTSVGEKRKPPRVATPGGVLARYGEPIRLGCCYRVSLSSHLHM